MGRVFANDPGDWGSISGRVIPKIQKMVLDAAFFNIIRYGSRVKWINPRKRVVPPCISWINCHKFYSKYNGNRLNKSNIFVTFKEIADIISVYLNILYYCVLLCIVCHLIYQYESTNLLALALWNKIDFLRFCCAYKLSDISITNSTSIWVILSRKKKKDLHVL